METDYIKAGLRFDHRDGPALLALAERAKRRELGKQLVSHFAKAAVAAQTGEPLVVICTDVDDLHQQVAAYIRAGIRPPAIETLTS